MTSIEMRLDSLARLYDSLDPAPFHDKALDRDAEAWLRESVDEVSTRAPLELVIRGPESLRASLPEIDAAVHAHFRRALEHEEWRLRRRMRVGRLALVIGLLVLAITLVARHLLDSVATSSADIVGEGLLIVGWVGLWRPAEMLLFERLENVADRAVLRRLSLIPIRFRALDEEALP
jgi:hypothetical protein